MSKTGNRSAAKGPRASQDEGAATPLAGQATSGGKRRADTEAMRAKAAELFAGGARLADVSRELGITERRARALKADVSEAIKAGAAATIGGIVESGERARERLADRGVDLANVLIEGAMGTLTDASGVIVDDPQMISARGRLASAGLQFVLGQKLDATIKPGRIDDETASAVLAIARAKLKAAT